MQEVSDLGGALLIDLPLVVVGIFYYRALPDQWLVGIDRLVFSVHSLMDVLWEERFDDGCGLDCLAKYLVLPSTRTNMCSQGKGEDRVIDKLSSFEKNDLAKRDDA